MKQPLGLATSSPRSLAVVLSILLGMVGSYVAIAEEDDPRPSEGDSESLANPPVEPGPAPEPAPISEADLVRLGVDKEVFPFLLAIEDDAILAGEKRNRDEHRAYNHILAFAATLDPDVMARQSVEVPYREMILDVRQDHLLKLVHIEGHLRRLVRVEPTSQLRDADKLPDLWEAWIFPEAIYNPVCVVFSDLPEGIEPGDDLNQYVSFDGYFFKLMRYETGEHIGHGQYRWRRAPLLLGHTIRAIPEPEGPANPWLSGTVGILLLISLSLVVLSAAVVFWWFNRTDRRVKEKYRPGVGSDPFGDGS